MTPPRVLDNEELTRRLGVLTELVLNIRYELGEPDKRHGDPIHTRLDTVETLVKRQTR